MVMDGNGESTARKRVNRRDTHKLGTYTIEFYGNNPTEVQAFKMLRRLSGNQKTKATIVSIFSAMSILEDATGQVIDPELMLGALLASAFGGQSVQMVTQPMSSIVIGSSEKADPSVARKKFAKSTSGMDDLWD